MAAWNERYPPSSGGGATQTDHGALAGLTDPDHPASAIINTPSGNLAATDVQAALNELQSDVDSRELATNVPSSVRSTILTGLSLVTNAAITAADSVLSAFGKIQKQITDHIANISNPHSVTKSQVGLGNVDNTSDVNKPVSTAQQTALDLKANLTGAAFTGISSVNVNSVNPALKVTQTGSGNAFVVEDVASDSTSFIVDASGNVGIGKIPSQKLDIEDSVPGGNVIVRIGNAAGNANAAAILCLDPSNNGFNTRDAQIRATNNGSNQTTLGFYTANVATPVLRMSIDHVGNMGLGGAPLANVLQTLVGDSALNSLRTASINLFTYSSTSSTLTSSLAGIRYRGDVASPSAVLSGDKLFGFVAGGATSSSTTSNSAAIDFHAAENYSSTNAGSYISFLVTTVGSVGRTERARLTGTGLTVTGVLGASGSINLPSYTVATLPAAGTVGRIACVTDALAPTFLVAVAGGGAVKTPVFDNGAAWVSF